MEVKEKVANALISKTAEGVAVAVALILIWCGGKLAPIITPIIEEKAPKELLISLLFGSLALNLLLLILFWALNRKKSEFRLKYGIYWDKEKNPHCPNCKIPIGGYNSYSTGGVGYYCKPCGKIFPLTDSSGNDIKPEQAVSEL
ncbi:hypothetical protein [Flavobacterium sp. W21_SRS_FM6]|uniref:hypothetical protein n=1 Tax=Flavobacterium sp. W21_SRS_FM6 TaxID=3240268 RepID=UPI003F90E700